MAADEQLPEEARERASTLSDIHYDLRVTLSDDPGAPTFQSVTEVTFDSSTANSWIDFCDCVVREASLNGQAFTATVESGRIALSDLAQHNTLRVVADIPYRTTGVGMHRQVDPQDQQVYVYTNCEPFNAHQWFPCFDQPDLKATLHLTVTAPSAWQVIANNPVERDHGGSGSTRTVSFKTTPPLSTYLMALVGGPYERLDHTTASGIDCGLLVRRSLAAYLDHDYFFRMTESGLDFFAERFGRPYPFAKYDQILVPEFNSGAMENPGCITFRDSVCVFLGKPTEGDYELIAEFLLHEMAHMWFGDLVTLRGWEDLWLNESFAELMGRFALNAINPEAQTWCDFAVSRKAWGLAADQRPSTHPVAADPSPVSLARANFDGISYAKGAAALRQLIEFVGEDAFFAGARAYFDAHAWSNASFDDLLTAVEGSSGRSLREWAQRWLRTRGPSLISAEVETDGSDYRKVVLRQQAASGDEVLRPHRLRLGVYRRADDATLMRDLQVSVELPIDTDSIEVAELAGLPVADLLLVNDDDATYAKVRFDERSLHAALESLGSLADPLARAVVWGTLWDMVRDADLSPRAYVECVAGQAIREDRTALLERVLEHGAVAATLYLPATQRAAARAALAAVGAEQMHSQRPGSDEQLLWARLFIAQADEPSDLALLERLLAGTETVDGLEVDTALRWRIVQSLVARAGMGEIGIRAEEERDPTDVGHRQALAARGRIPTVASKAEWWSQVTDPQSPLSLQERLAVAGGLMSPTQEPLLQPFVAAYETAIPQVWAAAAPEVATALTMALYPMAVTDADLLDMAERMAASDLPAPALRVLRDNLDDSRRLVRVRSATVLPVRSA